MSSVLLSYIYQGELSYPFLPLQLKPMVLKTNSKKKHSLKIF